MVQYTEICNRPLLNLSSPIMARFIFRSCLLLSSNRIPFEIDHSSFVCVHHGLVGWLDLLFLFTTPESIKNDNVCPRWLVQTHRGWQQQRNKTCVHSILPEPPRGLAGKRRKRKNACILNALYYYAANTYLIFFTQVCIITLVSAISWKCRLCIGFFVTLFSGSVCTTC